MSLESDVRPSLHPALDHFLLGGAATDVALVDGDTALTYAQLADAVAERAVSLAGPGLLVLPLRPDLEGVVSYLAALALHRPVLLLEPGEAAAPRRAEIESRYDGGEPAETHPDLALLLSTSGSTGSPKLVRLSRTNVLSNARSIADYLDLRSTDVAITTLPLHYCYGLSVLHSHLVAGATIVLSDHSVTDQAFWRLAADTQVTGLAGVPYTFDLLTAAGSAADAADGESRLSSLPHLRYVTQAGGRMAPEKVRAQAELGERHGHDFYVMYGQTEATARMAYLPPRLAQERPTAVGIAVPGGAFRLHEPDAEGVGELVYSGPNVMMGYATGPADLARGADLSELFTGDLARIDADGLVEIVGRHDRVAKVFGLRLDLGRIETALHEVDPSVHLVAVDEALHAFTTRPRTAGAVRRHLQQHHALPASAVHVHQVDELPRTTSGKPDQAALVALARAAQAPTTREAAPGATPGAVREVTPESLRELYAVLLGRPDAGLDDSFVSLGGDSLSFVELSTRLGSTLGQLPRSWPTLTVTELADRCRPSRTSRWSRALSAPLEIGVVMRALAILIVVITHVDLVIIPGGAHLLLAVAGYHLARFTLPTRGRRARTRRILGSIATVAVPASLWIAACALITGDYRWTTAVYLNGAVSYRSEGGLRWTLDWQFWFLEAIVWGFLAVAAFLSVPAIDRWHRRAPFAVAAAVVAATTALRYLSVGVEGEGVERYAVPSVLFVLALGW
ncbi:AMP-binding protein, partial [Nocardioides sp.]|uniref:AMP-binding protein n=1 Tax=Nocardioides sp. TaxID=35761 RepID=UPI002B264E7E